MSFYQFVFLGEVKAPQFCLEIYCPLDTYIVFSSIDKIEKLRVAICTCLKNILFSCPYTCLSKYSPCCLYISTFSTFLYTLILEINSLDFWWWFNFFCQDHNRIRSSRTFREGGFCPVRHKLTPEGRFVVILSHCFLIGPVLR